MKKDRLDNCLIRSHFYKSVTDTLNTADIPRNFVSANEQRKMHFEKFGWTMSLPHHMLESAPLPLGVDNDRNRWRMSRTVDFAFGFQEHILKSDSFCGSVYWPTNWSVLTKDKHPWQEFHFLFSQCILQLRQRTSLWWLATVFLRCLWLDTKHEANRDLRYRARFWSYQW